MPLDWTVIGLYFAGMLAIGWYYSLRSKTAEDYLVGSRSMRSSSIGLSLFATLMSTITYLALPGEMINKGPALLWSLVAIPIAYVVVGYILIPRITAVRVTSAYELLEAKLGLGVRLTASIMFLVTRLFWMALVIYLTSDKVIRTMMNWDPEVTPYIAAIIGLVTVVYTSMGGIRAVVLTDVIQSIILLCGAILAILMISLRMGGVSEWWPHEWSSAWDDQPVFSLDPRVRVTVVGSMVFMTVWWICTAGSDQMAVQRYLSTRDTAAARRAFLVTGISNVVVTLLLAMVGFALLGLFRSHPDLLGNGMTIEKDADKLFPYYIIHLLPPGVTGLVIAGLLAAAMSSLSSGINSSCSVITVDWQRLRNGPVGLAKRCPLCGYGLTGNTSGICPECGRDPASASGVRQASDFTLTRIIAVVSGLIAVLLSSFMGYVSGNIMAVTARTNHVFVAPLFGLFFMALFVPFANATGAIAGAIAGGIVAILIAYWDMITGGPELSFQWISIAALVVDLGVGCAVSLLTGGASRRQSTSGRVDVPAASPDPELKR